MSAPIRLRRVQAVAATLVADALAGLQSRPKTLPPKYFYDAVGAELFERICEVPEYYVTRTELAILRAAAPEIARAVGPGAALVEYGSGAGLKVRLLLEAFERPAAYVPLDISCEQLDRVAGEVGSLFPAVEVLPVCADFTRALRLPTLPAGGRPVAFFPGSTIGNFHPTEAAALLRRMRRTLRAGGALILGVDRPKPREVLEAAYDDAAGVTAAFNRNLLVRLNREADADFDLDRFRHHACWNAEASRVEMHLVSVGPQLVHVAGVPIPFADGESIWTECSYKYSDPALQALAVAAGFELTMQWSDPAGLFRVALLQVPRAGS